MILMKKFIQHIEKEWDYQRDYQLLLQRKN